MDDFKLKCLKMTQCGAVTGQLRIPLNRSEKITEKNCTILKMLPSVFTPVNTLKRNIIIENPRSGDELPFLIYLFQVDMQRVIRIRPDLA